MPKWIKRLSWDTLTTFINSGALWIFSNYVFIHAEHNLPTLTWMECVIVTVAVGIAGHTNKELPYS